MLAYCVSSVVACLPVSAIMGFIGFCVWLSYLISAVPLEVRCIGWVVVCVGHSLWCCPPVSLH